MQVVPSTPMPTGGQSCSVVLQVPSPMFVSGLTDPEASKRPSTALLRRPKAEVRPLPSLSLMAVPVYPAGSSVIWMGISYSLHLILAAGCN